MLRFVLLFVILVSAALAYGQSECSGSEVPRAAKAYEKARNASRNGDSGKAYELYLQAIEEDPDFADPFYRLGMINRNRARKDPGNQDAYWEKAILYFRKVEELCPDYDHYMYYFLGEIEFIMEKFSDAASHLEIFVGDHEKVRTEADYDDAMTMLKQAKFYASMMENSVPFEPRVVEGISTSRDEYRLLISPDNEIALFTRKIETQGRVRAYDNMVKYEERFMYSERENGEFGPGQSLPWPFNQTEHESGSLTADNNTLFLMICKFTKDQRRYYNCDICISKREGEYWGELQNLGPGVNQDSTWEAQPSISSDGKELYFTSDRQGGLGGYDIWKSTMQEDGTWGKAVNMGPSVNTEGDEMSPYIHSDSQTLYFASGSRTDENGDVHSGHMGMGGYDIFFIKVGKEQQWKKPKNIGYPINTIDDEIAFFVSTDGKLAYFASNKIDGNGGWDIYSFELYEEARPEKVLFVKGYVQDEDDQPIREATVELKNVTTKAVTTVPVDEITGKYVAVLPFRNDYVLTVKRKEYTWETRYISRVDKNFDKPVTLELQPRRIEVGASYRLNDIYFESNSDELTGQSLPVIDGFIEFLTANPEISVAIHGHTDNIGSDADNLDLSERRALRVYSYILDNGILLARMSHQGFGESRPIASNDTEEGRALNRRTEFVITGM